MTTPKARCAGLALIAALVVAAIISVPASVQSGMPDISKLPSDQRRWVEDACPRWLGPSLYRSCVERQLSALGAGIPNISKLPPDQRRWVEDACPRSFGPSLYRSCVERQLGALGTSPSPSRRVPPPHLATSPKAVPAPPPTKRYDAPKSAATAALFEWPSWRGSRPGIPSSTSTREISSVELFRRVAPAIYVVVAGVEGALDASQGSAVAVSSKHLVTNCHVLMGKTAIYVAHDKDIGRARILRADPSTDRCFLETADLTLRPVPSIRPYSDLNVGEQVYSIGTPSGLERTLADGLISGLRSHKGIRFIQTSAPVSSGSSGGGLFDTRGNLLGITTFVLRDAHNLNFAIAAEEFWR